ncbi:hypothetical protein JAAARDRAFT_29444 [Jaapia argillacea MUCL 33604]|uniref:Uncharacterized protein n=1 Tax=Jaapia argillacea MUCL 33604 TaxID=933084 RepID=A0A067Q8N5_9AGAM|nr:hypothetical protein JAAARDRAFT_29444 [Jaapia argillacea MUCL 33604]
MSSSGVDSSLHMSPRRPIRTATTPAKPATNHSTRKPVVETDMNAWDGPRDDSGWWDHGVQHNVFDLKAEERRCHVDMVRDMVPFWIRGVEAAQKGETLRMDEFLDNLEDQRKISGWDEVPEPLHKDSGLAVGKGWDAEQPNGGWGTVDGWWADQVDARQIDTSGANLDGGWGTGNGWDSWGPQHSGGGWGNEPAPLAQRTADLPKSSQNTHSGRGRNDWKLRQAREGKKPMGRAAPVRSDRPQDSWKFVETVARKEEANPQKTRKLHDFYQMPTQDKVKSIQDMIRDLHSRPV